MPPSLRHRIAALAAFAIALPFAGAAAAGEAVHYSLDPVHTRVMFAIDHAGFSKAIGTVSGSEGVLHFDADDWARTTLDVQVPMQRLDMGDANWAASILAPRFLDVQRYPHARFVSRTVARHGDNRGTACGELTLHGVTRPLCMELTLNRIARHPLPPFRRTAGFSANARLKRSDYGITAWPSLVGDEVELRIEAELVRRDNDDAPPAAEAPAPDAIPH